MFHKLIAWAKEHKYLSIATGVAFVVLLYVLFHAGSSSSAGNLTFAQQLQLAAQQNKFQLSLAGIQAKAADAPYTSQSDIASTQASAEEKLATTQAGAAESLATTQAGVQNNGIAAALQQALASITGQVTINQENNATQQQSNTLAAQTADTSFADQLQEFLAGITGQETINQQNDTATEQEQQAQEQESILQELGGWAENPNSFFGKFATGAFANIIGQGSWFQQWLAGVT